MKGHGTKFGRKKEEAIAALLTQRNLDEAAKSIGIAPNTLLKWIATRSCGGSSGRRRHSGVACGSVAAPRSRSIRSRPERGLEGQTNPVVRLLPHRNLDLAFASLAETTTCCGLLKQPDNQKSANQIIRSRLVRWCSSGSA